MSPAPKFTFDTDAAARFVEADDLPGTLRLLKRWRELPPNCRIEMGERASRCFRQRFHIDQSARSFIAAIQTHGNKNRRTGEIAESSGR